MRKTFPTLGQGPRPQNPHVAIMWAARRGQGLHLRPDEVFLLSQDGAIEGRAAFIAKALNTEDTPND